jgi:Glutathione S-transferase, N-terminal domain
MVKVSAFAWVPPFAQGLVRDLHAAGRSKGRHRLRRAVSRPEDKTSKSYRGLQPFGQVPAYENGELKLFESGAIVMHIAIYSMAPSFVCSRVATIAAYTSCVMATPSLSRRANNSKISSLSALFSILRRISSGNFIGASYQNTLCLI